MYFVRLCVFLWMCINLHAYAYGYIPVSVSVFARNILIVASEPRPSVFDLSLLQTETFVQLCENKIKS